MSIVHVRACNVCEKRPATIYLEAFDYEADGSIAPSFCDECGTPCGDECCGAYEHWRADEIQEAWANGMRSGELREYHE